MGQKPTPRDRKSQRLARLLDREFFKQLAAKRYDPRAFDKVLAKELSKTSDPWEQLEIRRRCAGFQLYLAGEYERGLTEVRRLFNKQKRLGYSSLDDEFGHLTLYCGAPLGRAEVLRRLHEFAEKVAKLRSEAEHMDATVGKVIARVTIRS